MHATNLLVVPPSPQRQPATIRAPTLRRHGASLRVVDPLDPSSLADLLLAEPQCDEAPPVDASGTPAAADAAPVRTTIAPPAEALADATPANPSPDPDARPVRRARVRPSRDMPRERILDAGPGALSDTELVALMLGSGLPGHDVFDVARSLLDRFGSLRAMLGATSAEFRGVRGIGPAKTAQLLAIVELARRALAEEMHERPLVDSPEAVENYLKLLIGTRPHEVFVCLFLDARNRLICSEETSRGSLTRMTVYPREIVRRALSTNAARMIVAHNHPSGAVKPSASDRQLTNVLRDTLAMIDVQLIDHLVIGARDTFSFARSGWS